MSFFLWTGVTFASFHWLGNFPVSQIFWKIICNGKQISLPQRWIIDADMLSGPWALLDYNAVINGWMSMMEIFIEDNLLWVCGMNWGRTLLVTKGTHCLAKKSLNIVALSLLLTINWFSEKRGGIRGTLHLLRNSFKIFQ